MSNNPFIHKLSLSDARRYLAGSGHPFVQFFTHGSLTVELYAPKGADKQKPHDRDEVYVIASGGGTFRLEGTSTPFARGDVLFAPARKRHRFTGFTSDFSTWVFFYGPVNGERGIVQNNLFKERRNSRMAKLKTTRNKKSVTEFLSSVKDPARRKDCFTLLSLMKKATGDKPAMWGTSIVGFGTYHYKSDSGSEGDWFMTGFSPRKQNLTVYIISGFGKYQALMNKLGKFKTSSGSCLYMNSLDDVHIPTLRTLIRQSVIAMRKRS